jgi:hypothetical protein
LWATPPHQAARKLIETLNRSWLFLRGDFVGGIVVSGGTYRVSAGHVDVADTVQPTGSLFVLSGGTTISTLDIGHVTVSPGGTDLSDTVSANGAFKVGHDPLAFDDK